MTFLAICNWPPASHTACCASRCIRCDLKPATVRLRNTDIRPVTMMTTNIMTIRVLPDCFVLDRFIVLASIGF